jgi:transposase-like protein
MKRERKRYDGTLKAKVAVEAIKGQRTVNEIASAYGIHPHQVTQWKKQALERPALSGNRPVEGGTRLAQKKIWFAPLRTVADGSMQRAPI